MSRQASSNDHLTPEDAAGFLDRVLSRRRLREIEEHLDLCPGCVEGLASIVRSRRGATEGEDEALRRVPARTPEEILRNLRPLIVATSPPAGSRSRFEWTWNKLAPAAAVLALVVVASSFLYTFLWRPWRGRIVAAQAMSDLVKLRQATGRVPLRYYPGFERARVLRSDFDTPDPAEKILESRLRQAVEMAPDEESCHLSLGLFLLDRGDLDGAEAALQAALEIRPDSSSALNGLAAVYYERAVRTPSRALDHGRRGLALLKEAQKHSPGDLQVAFNLAMFYQMLGAPERARQAWEAYIEKDKDPDSEWVQIAKENLDALKIQ